MHVDGGAGEPSAPKPVVCFRKPKHQMRVRISVLTSKVLLLRHHVAHGAGLWQWYFFLVECGFDTVEDLGFG